MSVNIDLVKKIQMLFPRLSKGQKLIAGYIMDNYDKAAFMTAARLGEKVGVSESTVVRFANDLDFEGYPQMHKVYRRYGNNILHSVSHPHVLPRRSAESLGDIPHGNT